MASILDVPAGALIVSCQAPPGSFIDSPGVIAAIAQEAIAGGAAGLRIEGIDDLAQVRSLVAQPVIGLLKARRRSARPLITVDFDACRAIAATGADMIAIDASYELHPTGATLDQLIHRVRTELGLPVMADVSTFGEGERAVQAGAQWVGTTLSGYTPETACRRDATEPDFGLLEELLAAGYSGVLEGRVSTPEDVERARRMGARAVVVGTAITNPRVITESFNVTRASAE